MTEWSDEAIEKELVARKKLLDKGICPDSGYRIHDCHKSVCDCFDADSCEECWKGTP